MTNINFTHEQSDIIDHLRKKNGITLVNAGAGCGKSFLAHQIAKLLNPKKGLYTAFNKAIVQEGVEKFKGTNVECKTIHALAYKYCKPKKPIEDLSYTCIKEDLPYNIKYQIITTIDTFFVSSSVDMYEYMEEKFENFPHIGDVACSYIEKMLEGEIAPTFNFLLKYFHLLLSERAIDCNYDVVFLDEINDTTAVALEIFKLIEAPKKIGLGESHQAIYKFLNLVNGFEVIKDADRFCLTKSYRCSEAIAEKIDKFMKTYASEDFKFIGTDDPVHNGRTLYCTSTNASIIKEISHRVSTNQGFHLLRKPSEIFACPLALLSAMREKPIYQKKYKFLETEFKKFKQSRNTRQGFFSYLVDETEDKEVQTAVNLLMYFQKNGINLYDLYNSAKEAPVDVHYTIATVFSSKGLEFETVYMADDMNTSVENALKEPYPESDSDEMVALRCYYVAASRAGKNLYNAVHLN